MAEVFFNTTGSRIFSVFSEGKPVMENLDLVLDIGASFAAKIYPFGIEVSDGSLTIEFVASVDKAKVSGVEVFFQPGVVAPPFGAPVTPPKSPVASPVSPPVAAPVVSPVTPPVTPPAAAPVTPPMAAPIVAPVKAPAAPPVTAPATGPVASPMAAPVAAPVTPPNNSNVVARVNCGSFQFSQTDGTVWATDSLSFHSGGANFTDNNITVCKYFFEHYLNIIYYADSTFLLPCLKKPGQTCLLALSLCLNRSRTATHLNISLM